MTTMNMLTPDESGRVLYITPGSGMARRFTDLGIIEGTHVTCVGYSPSDDPHAYLIRGAVVAIRNGDATAIVIERAAI